MAKKKNKKIIKKKVLKLKGKKKPLKILKSKKSSVSKKKKKIIKKVIKKVTKKKTLTKKRAKKVKKIYKKPIILKVGKKTIPKQKKIYKKIGKPRKKKAKVIKSKKPSLKPISFAKSLFKAKIKVIGIGGGGGSIVSEIGRSLDKAKFVISDTDARNFTKKKGIKYFLFGQKLTHGLGTGLNPDLAKQAASEEKEKIAKIFDNEDMVIFVASLGGGVGSGATSVFAEVAQKLKAISFGIFTMPFKFEGKNKLRIANRYLKELRKYLNVSIVIQNEKIFKIINPDTSITEAFSTVNKNLIESLESLIDLIYNPGIINIDFADLRAILKGDGGLAFLNTVEASGKEKIKKISEELLNNPLYQSPKTIEDDKNRASSFIAEKILFNIVGGKNLSMLEVNQISNLVSSQNPKAKIIFGISKNSKYKDKLKVTILITGASLVKEKTAPPKLIKLPTQNKKAIPTKSIDKSKIKNNKSKKITIPKVKPVTVSHSIPISFDNSMNQRVTEKVGTIRRSALEIKKDQEIEENKKSEQEKEWEIPTFLRLKK